MIEAEYKLLAGDMLGPTFKFFSEEAAPKRPPSNGLVPNPYPYHRKVEISQVLPYQPKIRAIELGGGEKPAFHPNFDGMPGPGVDHVCDLSQGIPLEDGSVGFVYSMFMIEHIKHVHLPKFISEIHRVLIKGGVAVMVTANLFGQCRLLARSEHWDEDVPYLIFGGHPDFEYNYHHTGFSPESAVAIFKKYGFTKVAVWDYPPFPSLEMIIEALK